MARRRIHRFRHPPRDPISARDSSLAFRLNLGFFLRQLIIFAVIDLTIFLILGFGRAVFLSFPGTIWSLLLGVQAIILLLTLVAGERTVRKILRPIQDLAASAARLSTLSHTSRQDLRNLASELDQIGVDHLDSRVDISAEQQELKALAQAINDMLDRVDRAFTA